MNISQSHYSNMFILFVLNNRTKALTTDMVLQKHLTIVNTISAPEVYPVTDNE